MENYQEGMAALYICLTVLNLSAIATVYYYVKRVRERVRQEGEIERMKINILVESLIEIFESKQDENEKRNNGGTSDIPRRD